MVEVSKKLADTYGRNRINIIYDDERGQTDFPAITVCLGGRRYMYPYINYFYSHIQINENWQLI